jgi:hypothetical protein
MEAEERKKNEIRDEKEYNVYNFKRRMLEWPNPVEYVNNMYGAHPDVDHMKYFLKVFEN